MSKDRVFNFSAGPATLPKPVVEKAREDLLNYSGCGIGVMELSHRGPEFSEIISSTESLIRKTLAVPENYHVLFLPGGATMQFSMVPMNLLRPDMVADYLVTGTWAKKAYQEASKFGATAISGTTEHEDFLRLPTEIKLNENSAYLHFTSNNTVYGTQFKTEPQAGNLPLICDASSDFLSRPLDVSNYGLIYAGAQKNAGAAGVTVVIVKDELIARCPEQLPLMLDYRTYVQSSSLYNTPPTFPIYTVRETLRWIENQGGLEEIQNKNAIKAETIYSFLDSSDFYNCPVESADRSNMNVVFHLKDEDKTELMLSEALKQGLSGLKGHRSVGGCRASIYNAFPLEGVQTLTTFLESFAKSK